MLLSTRLLVHSCLLLSGCRLIQALLWFPDAPNNFGDCDGLTVDGTFHLRYNNGACPDTQLPRGQHAPMGIHSYAHATSHDGVHFVDRGIQMLAFDEGKVCEKMNTGSGSVWVARTGEYVINYSHGSTLRFMTSRHSPAGPWTPVGSADRADSFGPGRPLPSPCDGAQYYSKAGRWDTINSWWANPSNSTERYGWLTASPLHTIHGMGMVKSTDSGVSWCAEPPALFDYGKHTFKGPGLVASALEVGGCAYHSPSKQYFCLNGGRGSWASIDDKRGMYTFVSSTAGGPYTLSEQNWDVLAYSSSWFGDAPAYFTRFWGSNGDDLLVVHQSYGDFTVTLNYEIVTVHITPDYEIVHVGTGNTNAYLAPLKAAVVDSAGTLRLAWWTGNEQLKSRKVNVTSTTHRVEANNVNGTVLEGAVSGVGGLLFHNANASLGGGVLCEVGLKGVWGVYEVNASGHRTLLEVIDRVVPFPKTWRVLVRASMVELYADDILVLPFPLLNNMQGVDGEDGKERDDLLGGRPATVGVEVSDGWTTLQAWVMSLPALYPMEGAGLGI